MSALIEVLAAHRKSWNVQSAVATCTAPDCDWGRFGTITQTTAAHAEHVAEAIAAAGLAVVKLPERGEVNPDAWANQAGGVTLRHHIDLVSNFTAAHARDLAGALLAAANTAEAVE